MTGVGRGLAAFGKGSGRLWWWRGNEGFREGGGWTLGTGEDKGDGWMEDLVGDNKSGSKSGKEGVSGQESKHLHIKHHISFWNIYATLCRVNRKSVSNSETFVRQQGFSVFCFIGASVRVVWPLGATVSANVIGQKWHLISWFTLFIRPQALHDKQGKE